MKTGRSYVCAVIGIAAGVAELSPAHSQQTGKVMIDVAECINLDAPEARLACYESRVAGVFRERAAQAEVARPAPRAPAVAAVARVPDPAPGAPPAAPAATSTVSVASAVVPAATEPQQTRSRDDRVSRRGEKAQAPESAAASDIVSRVTEAREVVPHAYMITLENGQVWRQTVSKQYDLHAGQQVKIYTTHWGNASRLSADDLKGYIQVERVR